MLGPHFEPFAGGAYDVDPGAGADSRDRARRRRGAFMDRRRLGRLIHSRLGASSGRRRRGKRRSRDRRARCSASDRGRPVRAQTTGFTGSGFQPLSGCRKFFPAFLEFALQVGELSGALLQLLPRLRKLRLLAFNHLIFRLKLFQVGLRGQRKFAALYIPSGNKGDQSRNQHRGRPDKLRRDREFLAALQAGSRLRRRLVAIKPLGHVVPRELGFAKRTFRGVFRDAVGAVWAKPRPRGGFSDHDLPSSALKLPPSSRSARRRRRFPGLF
jgi:hypothetical protein